MNLPGVAFGHDWLVAADRYAGTLEHLASWGIVAAAPEHRDRLRAVGAEPGVRPGHDAGHHLRRAAGPGQDQRAPHQAGRRRPRFRRLGRRLRRRGHDRPASRPPSRCSPSSPNRPPNEPAASLRVPGLILADPGDPMSLRSNAVELARAWKPATLRDVKKVTAGGLVEGRRLSPGAQAARRRQGHPEDRAGAADRLPAARAHRRQDLPGLRRSRGRRCPRPSSSTRSPTIPSRSENKVVALLKP